MACNGCKIGRLEALRIFHNRQKCLEIFNNHKITDSQVRCIECDEVAKLSENNSHWYCQSGHGFERLTRLDDWLECINIFPIKCCIFMALYLQTDPPNSAMIAQELKIASDIAICWSIFFDEVFEDWCLRNSAQELGGPNITVEMNEAELEDNRYSGRSDDGKWIFSAVEQDSGNFFFEVVLDKSSSTLVKLIKKRICPGTKILFKSQMACGSLKEEGFNSIKASYNISWLDPNTNTYTQDIPKTMSKDDQKDYCKSGEIADMFFRKRFSDPSDRIHHFLIAVKNFNRRDSSIEDEYFNEEDERAWDSTVFYLICVLYCCLASLFFNKILVRYDIHPFITNFTMHS